MNIHTANMLANLARLGISQTDALALRRIATTLQRWSERKCNGEIQRDDETGKVFIFNTRTGEQLYGAPDLEKGALKRLAKIMERYPELGAYIQGDPRGAPLYIYRRVDLDSERLKGCQIDSCYSSIGIAVHS